MAETTNSVSRSRKLGPEERAAAIASLREREVDVLVIGGGIVGTGAALDAVTRGLRVGLIEGRDFASGTSSRSSKLIHGGIRYLEQANFGLVREALIERGLLLQRLAPHLVKPVKFLYPLTTPLIERAYIGAGMAMYDAFSYTGFMKPGVPMHRHLTKKQMLKQIPSLDPNALVGGLTYYDGQVDDARYVAELARTASFYGAHVASRVRAEGFLKVGERVVGVQAHDYETGEQFEIRAKQVVNATGVWTGDTQAMVGSRGEFKVRASKGVHLVVPRDRFHSSMGLLLRTEKSVLFVIPWGRHWIIGTTDTDWELDKAHPAATAADIDYIRVDAHHAESRLHERTAEGREVAPVQLRWVDARCRGGTALELLGNTELNGTLAEICASDIVSLLTSSAKIDGRPPRPDDVAVLVRSHSQAAEVLAALQARDVPAVVSSQGQVFATPEALSLQRWLQALAGEGDEGAARVLAADPLLGWSAAELPAGGGEGDAQIARWWESWLVTLAIWRTVFARQGFMAAFRSLLDHVPPWARDRGAVGPHLLTLSGGERRMTDLLHLAELLHGWHLDHAGGLVGLQVWLARQREQGHPDAEAAELRLERDDNAVKVVTVHKSKGLQYGVVFVPFAWKDEGARVQAPFVASHPSDLTVRELVLLDSGDAAERARNGVETAAREEGVRLLYVALTRARHRCVVYWPGMKGGRGRRVHSPLAAVLHGAAPGAVAKDGRVAGVLARFADGEIGDPAQQLAELEALARGASVDGRPTLAVSVAGRPQSLRWQAPPAPKPRIRARQLAPGRVVDDGWRRHSYSALTRADLAAQAEEMVDPAHGLGFDDDGRHRPRGGERGRHAVEPPPELDAAVLSGLSDLPMAGFPAGADAGTCLHAIFEFFDFAQLHPDCDEAVGLQALERVASRELARHGFADPALVELVAATFPAVLQTPLGPLLPDHRLCDIARADRLDELRFDFPIAGGDSHGRPDSSTARVTAEMLRDALLLRGSDDPVPTAWVERVGELGFAPLAGIMTGSIDLVFRVRAHDHEPGRWFVVDYKSNRLDPHQTGRTPTEHFRHAGMRYEMAHHHYFLQYHLYTLALHRFLRLRLGRRYDYDTHIGGVAYLFVRGMTGPNAVDPTRAGGRPGVFCDRPPRSVIDALDAIFDEPGGRA